MIAVGVLCSAVRVLEYVVDVPNVKNRDDLGEAKRPVVMCADYL